MRAKLVMAYRPHAAAGNVLYDGAAMDGSGTRFVICYCMVPLPPAWLCYIFAFFFSLTVHVPHFHSETAVLLQGSRVCMRRLLRDILLCVGGVQQILPLFAMLDQPMDAPDDAPRPTAAEALDLVAAVLAGRPHNWRDIRHVHGTRMALKRACVEPV